MSFLTSEGAAPSTPATGKVAIYAKTDGLVYSKDDAGVETVFSGLISGTQVSLSGTSVDFTGIPSWVKKITILFNGVSTNGTSVKQIQIGDSGGIETSGYNSASSAISATGTATSGFILTGTASVAARAESGPIYLSSAGNNVWVSSSSLSQDGFAQMYIGAGVKTLSDTLTQIRVTTVNGTDTFDAGTVNIIYE